MGKTKRKITIRHDTSSITAEKIIPQNSVVVDNVITEESASQDEFRVLDPKDFPPLSNQHCMESNSMGLIQVYNEQISGDEDIYVTDSGPNSQKQKEKISESREVNSSINIQKQHEKGSETRVGILNAEEATIHVDKSEEQSMLSYSNVVRGQKYGSPMDFVIRSVSKQSLEGDPAFIITNEEWQESLNTCKWQCILKFSMARPSLKYIREQITSSWGLTLAPTVGLLDNRHVMVSAHSDDNCSRILSREDCRMGRVYFRVFRWSKDFNKQRESPIIQRWIRLPGLPSNCCSPAMLKGIGDSISKYIAADQRTVSKEIPGYARICVEIDVSKNLPKRVWIGTSTCKSFWQVIIIKGRTDYCVNCKLHGHTTLNCRHAAGQKQNSYQKAARMEVVQVEKINGKVNITSVHDVHQHQKGQLQNNKEYTYCSHCKKDSHMTADCWLLKNMIQRKKWEQIKQKKSSSKEESISKDLEGRGNGLQLRMEKEAEDNHSLSDKEESRDANMSYNNFKRTRSLSSLQNLEITDEFQIVLLNKRRERGIDVIQDASFVDLVNG